MFTDANDYNTSGMVTQIPACDVRKPIQLQRHEPLGFVGHRFSGAELNWSVAEKEGFAIKDTMQKLAYLLQMRKPFKLFCDHKNLIQIFSPSQVTKPTAQKLQRWALEMQRFCYEIEHIKGDDNLWADLMTRRGANPGPEEPRVTVRRTKRMQITDDARVRPLHRPEFVWPSVEELKRRQEDLLQVKNPKYNEDGLIITYDKNKIIIPEGADDLKIRLCVIAHSGGNSGHLGLQAAVQKLAQYFTGPIWPRT
jgi:hypothetical protein